MGFGGSGAAAGKAFGATACLVNSACIAPAGIYSAAPNGVYVAGGPFWCKNATAERSVFYRVVLTGQAGMSVLGSIQAAAAAVAACDTGVLTSSAATGCRHGLPANFGPGRGNWCAADVARIRTMFFGHAPAATAAGSNAKGGSPYLNAVAVAGGNITLTFHNRARFAVPAGSSVVVEYVLPGWGRA